MRAAVNFTPANPPMESTTGATTAELNEHNTRSKSTRSRPASTTPPRPSIHDVRLEAAISEDLLPHHGWANAALIGALWALLLCLYRGEELAAFAASHLSPRLLAEGAAGEPVAGCGGVHGG